MPLTFARRVPTDDTRATTAAQVLSLNIDLVSKRVIGLVGYGSVVGGNFVENKSIPQKTVVFDGADFLALATATPDPAKNMYENIKTLFWQTAINKGIESGSIS